MLAFWGLERDAAEGKVSRKEILEEIQKDVKPCEEKDETTRL